MTNVEDNAFGPSRTSAGTYPAALAALASALPDHDAIIADDGRATWAELDDRVRAMALRLAGTGIRRGDRVGVMLPNGLRWIVAALAVQRAGGTAVPINTWYRSSELRHVAESTGLRLVVADLGMFGRDIGADLRGAGLDPDAALDSDADFIGIAEWSRSGDWPRDLTAGRIVDAPAGDDYALILLTSGSTAAPKPVPLRHQRLLMSGRDSAQRMRITSRDRLWFASPLFFGLGCENALSIVLSTGATLIIQERHNDIEASLDTIEREGVTVYFGVVPATRALAKSSTLATRDLSRVRTGLLGFTAEDKRIARSLFPGMREGVAVYGLTETYGFIALTDASDPDEVQMTTEGRVIPSAELRVVDADGGPVAVGEVGEIEVRGAVIDEYYNLPDATSIAFRPDGWFRTGDLGRLDSASRMTFVARWKDMLKVKGVNITPAEVEGLVIGHPDVEDAFVSGYLEEGDDRVGCVVVTTAERVGLADDITRFVRGIAASYKVPTRFVFIAAEEVPATTSGKVDRQALKRLLVEE